MNSKEVLTSILERVKATRSAGRRPVVVLDLDATLFDNGPRSWVILSEFAEEAQNDVLKVALNGYRKDSLPYLLKDMFTEMGLQDEELLKSASKFWFERFFTDAYQAHDMPMAGAPKFVNELYNEGATVVYLSGRDSPGMLVGCSASLREHGFPVGLTNTAVVLKPDFETPDAAFKEDACRFMAELGEVVSTIDNEPGNVNLFHRQFPDAINVLIHTNAAPGAPEPSEGLSHIDDFASWAS